MTGRASRARTEILVIGALLSVVVVAGDVLFYPRTLEDAFITFRYAEHLSEGYGLGAWNTDGERVEGYTSTGWTLWLALAPFAGLSVATLAKWSGLLAHLALVWVFLLAARRAPGRVLPPGSDPTAERDLFLLAAAVPALSLPLAWYATSGMETVPFACLVALALVAPVLWDGALATAVVFAALVVARPEGALFAGAAGGLQLLRARLRGASARNAVVGLGAAGVALLALTGLRLALYGEIVPNTYYAKVAGGGMSHVGKGLAYLEDWAHVHRAWFALLGVAVVAAGVLCARRRWLAGLSLVWLAGLSLVFGAYVARAGGDNPTALPYWRHLLHLLPVTALLLAGSLVALLPRRRLARSALLVLALLVVDARTLQWAGGRLEGQLRSAARVFPTLSHVPPGTYERWIAEIAGPDTVIASGAAGELPYVVDAVHIDMLGLNDPHIAHHGRFDPDAPVDSKTDPDYVMSRRPDVIQMPASVSRFLLTKPGAGPQFRRPQLTTALLNDDRFRGHYLLVLNAPYGARDRALFLRREWWEGHPRREAIDVMPLEETGLYRFWMSERRDPQ